MQSPVAWHHQEVDDVLESLQTSRGGLSAVEAANRLKEYGKNELPQKPPPTAFSIFIRQFAGPLMLILVVAALISLMLREWLDAVVISVAILLNVGLGFVEEFKADQSLEALRHYLPEEVRVRRGGSVLVIASQDVVPGDVLVLSSGDKITADARLISVQAFETNEAPLTGESAPVKKSVAAIDVRALVADQSSMVFAGSTAVAGHAEAIVVGTGLNTEIGHISGLVESVGEGKTPLQKQLDQFGRILGVVVLFLAVSVFLVGVARGFAVVQMFEVAVALAVSAVPEGLAVAMTVILAIGMQRILTKHALVRRLVASETLGSVAVICVDKTGTITTGEMAVDELRTSMPEELAIGLFYTSAVHVGADGDGNERLSGTQTEVAIMKWLQQEGWPEKLEQKKCSPVASLPFDSKHKFSATLLRCGGELAIYAVGAPEILLANCDISDLERRAEQQKIEELTDHGLRVLMVVKKSDFPSAEHVQIKDVLDAKPIGYIGMRDPIRQGVPAAIEASRRAGLVPIMITGDHPQTALSIARDAGIIQEGHRMLTGAELDEMSDYELAHEVAKIDVYARVLPKHKIRIVQAWQAKGKSVAMTGDGVNDAPAIKAADIGIALGSGTQVAKETADMVLLKNDFQTIVTAIREGRIIFDNIRKVVVYLLADSFSEIILTMSALIFHVPLPILPAQILWINLITDGFPSVALTFEPGEKGIMDEPPRGRSERILNREMLELIFVVGIVTDVLLAAVYFYLLRSDVPINEVRTFIFVKLGLDSLIYVFAVRQFRSSAFSNNPFRNKWLILAVFGGLILQLIPIFFQPLRDLFEFVSLSWLEWLVVIALASLNFVMIEVIKAIFNHRRRKKIRYT